MADETTAPELTGEAPRTPPVSTNPSPPAIPLPATIPEDTPWRDRILYSLLAAVVAALTSGGLTFGVGESRIAMLESEVQVLRTQLAAHEAREERALSDIEETVGSIYEIVDRAHPRQ